MNGARRSWWLVYEWQGGQSTFRTTKHGEAKLVELAPPPPPGRLACVNPRCWRTFSKEKNEGYSEIVCGTCYKSVPEIRRERRELQALRRKTERGRRSRGDEKTDEALRRIDWRLHMSWTRMVGFFTAPEKPEGLETFLEEMGWKEDEDGEASDEDGTAGATDAGDQEDRRPPPV